MTNCTTMAIDHDLPASGLSEWIGKNKTFEKVPQDVQYALMKRLDLSADAIHLLPANSLPVPQLLEFSAPRLVDGLQIISPASCFTDLEINTTVVSLLTFDIPSTSFVQKLCAAAGQAILDGKTSLRDWRNSDRYLPLEAIEFWQWLMDVIHAQKAWNRALRWLDDQVKRNPTLEALQGRVKQILIRVAWRKPFSTLGNFATSVWGLSWSKATPEADSKVEDLAQGNLAFIKSPQVHA
ncbi:hypothetical protein EVG20_g8282 [Dentipellis fragilis]|uniref:Uncharacterized protein n=1 Tax=Dentipellis fragilis TaxID=205917 RepID=A0A4Y9Y9G1_9AGAM|nr:hypothetical protein EVG20_g8282 [Dentipellis fragilis]